MTDLELLERVRAARVELHTLSVEAKRNSKYTTSVVLARMSNELTTTEDALSWHVGENAND